MAQNFVGSNNINLLEPKGNFGSRYVGDAAAPRYIFIEKSKPFDSLFHSDDDDILEQQNFEGEIIEPKFYVPTLPIILINGSEGIGSGFAQKILPRNENQIQKLILKYLDKGEIPKKLLKPSYKGFKGTIEQSTDSSISWLIQGQIERVNTTTIHITEIPIGYDLSGYLKVLEKLVETREIKDYQDKSADDNFEFVVNVHRSFTQKTDAEIYDSLKLIKRVTENYTCVDENNMIREFKSAGEILKDYIAIKERYYTKRQNYLLLQITQLLKINENRYRFIREIIDKNIEIRNTPKVEIERILISMNFDKMDDSFDYLLKMPIYSLTKEKAEELKSKFFELQNEKEVLASMTIKDFWVNDLKNIKIL